MRKADGSISVILALTITMMLSFCLVLIESAREKTMLLKADIIFYACINSALAEYHQGLWEYYDVLYVDASYKTGMPNYAFMQNRLKYYADENLKYDDQGWLSLSYEGSTLSDVMLATDYDGYSFYQKAVDAIKFETGITVLEELATYLDTAQEYLDFSDELEDSKADITTQIETANGTEVVWEGETVEVEVENPLQEIESGNALLRAVVGESAVLSQNRIDILSSASHRTLAVGSAEISKTSLEANPSQSSILDKALYVEYVRTHFENYLNQEYDKSLAYELEYLIAGKESDIQNLEAVVARLLLLREVDNYIHLLENEAKKLEAHAIAAGMANVATWLEPIVYQAILIYWAYEMSIDELQLLFAGGEIPLIKSLSFAGTEQVTLNYEEYLCLLLLLEQREKLTMRSLDLVELFIRKDEADFHIDGCVESATLEGNFLDAYEKQYTVTKILEYN